MDKRKIKRLKRRRRKYKTKIKLSVFRSKELREKYMDMMSALWGIPKNLMFGYNFPRHGKTKTFDELKDETLEKGIILPELGMVIIEKE